MNDLETLDAALELLREAREVETAMSATPVLSERYHVLLEEAERVLIEASTVAVDRSNLRRVFGVVELLEQRLTEAEEHLRSLAA